MVDPRTYRTAPESDFADRLERVLLQRLTAEPDGQVSEGGVAQSEEPAGSDTGPDHRGDMFMPDTDERSTGAAAVRRRPADRSPLVAAAAVVVAVAGTLLVLASGEDGDKKIDTVTPIPTSEPIPTSAAPARDAMRGPLEPGRYFADPDGDDRTPLRVTFQVETDGWGSWFGAVKYVPGEGDGFTGLSITTVTNLVSDGCRDHTPLDPPVGPTVDDLTIALSQLAPFEVTAPPTDVTLFGHQGKHLELTVPTLPVTGAGDDSLSRNVAQFTDCVDGELHSWISPINDRSSGLLGHSTDSLGAFNAYQAPGQTEEFWILDVEGTRLVIVSFDSPLSPAEDLAERNAMFDSIRIEP